MKIMKTYAKRIMTLLLVGLLLACSKNDDASPRIVLGQLTSDYEGMCSHSSGLEGADYKITIPYNNTESDKLNRLLIKVTVEGGPTNEASSKFNDFELTDGSGVLTWNGCLLFMDADWVDFEVRIETTNGEQSTAAKIRLNRSDFDN